MKLLLTVFVIDSVRVLLVVKGKWRLEFKKIRLYVAPMCHRVAAKGLFSRDAAIPRGSY